MLEASNKLVEDVIRENSLHLRNVALIATIKVFQIRWS